MKPIKDTDSVKTSDFEFGSGNYVSFKFSADEK